MKSKYCIDWGCAFQPIVHVPLMVRGGSFGGTGRYLEIITS